MIILTLQSPVVTICATRFNIKRILHSAHTLYLYVLYGFENKQRLFPYTALILMTEEQCVYCAVRAESLHIIHVNLSFQAPSQNCEERLLASSCPSSRLTAQKKFRLPMGGFSWNFISEYLPTIKFSLKPDKNNEYFTWRSIHIFDHISFISSQNEKYFGQICRENQNTHIFQWHFLFRKLCRLWDNVKKNNVNRDRQQMTIWRMRIAYWIPKAANKSWLWLLRKRAAWLRGQLCI